ILQAEGHRTYVDRRFSHTHPLYCELIEAVGKERRNNLTNSLIKYPLDHYSCMDCFIAYLRRCPDQIEKEWRRKHLDQLIFYLKSFDNFRFHFTNACSRFNFTLKIPSDASGATEKLFFMGKAPHGSQREDFDHLTGFVTENQVVLQNFKEGLVAITNSVIEELEERGKMIAFLEKLLTEVQS
ncbi:MAG: hypothetical protein HQK55_17400, partial [Deltaproteobacteria bacterium]|nr:hypothetical protein [Deltaproteobacteria bacterium]